MFKNFFKKRFYRQIVSNIQKKIWMIEAEIAERKKNLDLLEEEYKKKKDFIELKKKGEKIDMDAIQKEIKANIDLEQQIENKKNEIFGLELEGMQIYSSMDFLKKYIKKL